MADDGGRPGRGALLRGAAGAVGVALVAMSAAAPANAAPAPASANAAPVAALANATPADVAAARAGGVQEAMDELARAHGVVGAVGGAYVDGKSIGNASAGTRLLDGKGGRIPPNSRFRIGSQTKQMVATVVLKLVEEGRLGVDDKLGDLLPVVVRKDLVERAGEITVRQMLRHTSGIPDWYAAEPGPDGSEGELSFDVFDFTTYYRPLDVVRWSRGRPRTGAPGERFSYSNTNYTLLGMIIERLTGQDLATALRDRLFRPLGMSKTYLPMKPPEGIRGPHGHGYYPDATGKIRDVDRLNASIGGAAGGVVSTAHDVSAFKRAFDQGRLLPPELQRVLTDRLPQQPPPGGGGGPELCGGKLQGWVFGGSTAGYFTLTFSSADGRRQLAMSATLDSKDTEAPARAMIKGIETVFCPGSSTATG